MSARAADHLAKDSAASQPTSLTNEKVTSGDATVNIKAEDDKKAARPERTATFRDYIVRPDGS